MNWLVLFYFPLGCLGVSWAGTRVLRASADRRGLPLAFCRVFLLVYPFLLLAVSLEKALGPGVWMTWAPPLPLRGLVLALVVGLVGARWVGEMVASLAFRWRVEGPDMERGASQEFLADLGYDRLLAELAPPRWAFWLPQPRLFLSKASRAAHLATGLWPRICLDASLVPLRYREPDLWWQSVLPEPGLVAGSLDPVRAVVAHELAHFQRGDHLRTLLTLLSGAILPWEWLYGQVPLDKFLLTNTWIFRQWSRFMAAVGRPFRRWLQEDHAIREVMADEAAGRIIPAASRHLEAIRALYPGVTEELARATPQRRSRVPGTLGVLALGGALLWAAPGRIPYFSTFGSEIMSTSLPEGWCLTLEGRSKASAVYIPGEKEPGRVLVACEHIDPGHPPEFRAIGRQRADSIPSPCEVEVQWDVHFIGAKPLTGKEAVLSLTQSGGMARGNMDLLAAYTVPTAPMVQLKNGWVRYALKIQIEGHPQMDILFICYTFSAPGRYLFRPPVLTLVLPGGQCRAYPAE